MDFVLSFLAVLLGASIANVIDEMFEFTPKLSAWLNSFLNES